MHRRQFVKYAASVTFLLANGKIVKAAEVGVKNWRKRKVNLRFVVASDGHYGQKDTDSNTYFKTLVDRINEEHLTNPFAFCMINGDIVHDDKTHYPAAKKALDLLKLPYYVSQGNHDHVTAAEWENIWSIPVNHDYSIGKNSFLIATTSNEKGDYLCPDISWMATQLEKYRSQKNVFIFIHINPVRLTKGGVNCSALFELFTNYKNVRGVFNGHDHDEEGIKIKNEIPFIFDGHFGGNWGTKWRGFRVVELLKDNSIATYIMNPFEKINEAVM